MSLAYGETKKLIIYLIMRNIHFHRPPVDVHENLTFIFFPMIHVSRATGWSNYLTFSPRRE